MVELMEDHHRRSHGGYVAARLELKSTISVNLLKDKLQVKVSAYKFGNTLKVHWNLMAWIYFFEGFDTWNTVVFDSTTDSEDYWLFVGTLFKNLRTKKNVIGWNNSLTVG